MKQRVLVIGSGGFIGRRVVDALALTDWGTPVPAYHRTPPAAAATDHVVIDSTDEAQLRQALPGIDGVVNCVAGNYATIVEGARSLFLAAAAQPKPPRIVHLSTMSVYGSATGVVAEDAELRGDLGAYSSAKVAAEHLAAAYPAAVTLRPGCVYGPGSTQWSERIASWLIARRIGDLGSAGDGYANLLYIDDLVAAILSALRTPSIEGEAFNLSMPNPPTWNEYFLAYARALGAVPLHRVSRRRLKLETKLLAPPLKIAEILLGRAGIRRAIFPPPIPPSLLGLWQQEIVLNAHKAEKLLQLKWTPLHQGLCVTEKWFSRRAFNSE